MLTLNISSNVGRKLVNLDTSSAGCFCWRSLVISTRETIGGSIDVLDSCAICDVAMPGPLTVKL